MRQQYDHGKGFLLANEATEEEALRRLSNTDFVVGVAQRNVLDEHGVQINDATPEIRRKCRAMVAKHIRDHFQPRTKKAGLVAKSWASHAPDRP
jgi:hypothetical protein